MRSLQVIGAFCTVGILCTSAARAGEREEFFTRSVKPILQENCFKCHSHDADKIKGGFVLDSLDGLLTGGDTGPAIVPGAPEKSLLIKAIRYTDENLQMPPKGKRLQPEQVAVIEKWVKEGAVWPGEAGKPKRVRGKITDEDRKWWAFQPLAKPALPSVRNKEWPRNDIDYFILAKLESADLKPSAEAAKTVLVRRLYFDLWGLPPTPEQIDEFVQDESATAYDRLVDKLLASPRYGERWARHWLDLVRYADSDGYKIDEFRPNAFRYRDYVIDSLNADKPYDQFVREQLAGDEMQPRTAEEMIATGYLRLWIYEYNNRDVVGQQTTILNDITDTTADVFLGMGMQCARCHDHKFDPILQKDYYRLQAFFAPLLPREDIDLASPAERADYQARLGKWEKASASVREQIEALQKKQREKAESGAIAKFPEETQAILKKPAAERTPLEEQYAQLAYRQVTYEFDHLRTRFKGAEKEKLVSLEKKLAAFDSIKPAPLPHALVVTDVGPVAPPVVIPKRPGEPIEPGFPTVLQEEPANIPATGGTNTTGRRTALAKWLTDPKNPLTARVMVNRVWQYHFGRGLVGTSSDFGHLGEKPSHPELLDWLAGQFIENGWSLKKLHRLIVTSAAYREGSAGAAANAGARRADPENRLLWHAPVLRLEAEQIRDALLAISGELQLDPGGPAVDTFKPRRTIYTKVLRNSRDPLLEVFDGPQNFASTPQRDATTTPVQSLFLINSPYMLQRARALEARLASGSKGDTDFITAAYRLVLGRTPDTDEMQAALKFLHDQPARIDPVRAASAAAGFIGDKIPYRDGKAALVSPKSEQERLIVPDTEDFPTEDFSIEAYIVLRSVYDGSQVRTIASHWTGRKGDPGWALGVTSLKSMRRPQTLVLQLTTKDEAGRKHYEPVFSDLHISLNKPYFVAATVTLNETNEDGITFYAKDLSNDDEPVQIAHIAHQVTGTLPARSAFVIGGHAEGSDHLFDGLVDDVRLSRGALKQEQLLLTSEATTDRTCGFWQFEPKPDVFRDSSPNHHNIRPQPRGVANVDRAAAARADFCHVLLNANGFLYVE